MSDGDSIEMLEKRKSRWDRVVGGLKFALGFYAFFVLTFLAIQGIAAQQQMARVLTKVEETTDAVRQSQLAWQKTGTSNHEKTRAYIKCLFTEVLTVPLRERTEVDFDTCTRQVDSESPNTDTQSSSNNATPATPQSSIAPQPVPSNVDPKPNQPIAGAPPDPDEPEGLRQIPLVDGLLKLLSL